MHHRIIELIDIFSIEGIRATQDVLELGHVDIIVSMIGDLILHDITSDLSIEPSHSTKDSIIIEITVADRLDILRILLKEVKDSLNLIGSSIEIDSIRVILTKDLEEILFQEQVDTKDSIEEIGNRVDIGQSINHIASFGHDLDLLQIPVSYTHLTLPTIA